MAGESLDPTAARRHGPALMWAGWLCALIGVGFLVFTIDPPRYALPPAFGLDGAALLLAGGTLVAAALMSVARQGGRGLEAGAPQIMVGLIAALAALGCTAEIVKLGFSTTLPPGGQLLAAGILVLLAFPALVLQRHYAAADPTHLPEARALDRLLRVPVAAFLGTGIATGLAAQGLGWAVWIDYAVAAIVALVAFEMLLRVCALIFLPLAPLESRRAVTDSALAGLLALTRPTFARLSEGLRSQFGIDLSRSWALDFLRRALVPAAAGTVLLAWLVTGLTALPLDQRAVYERFGAPVAVLGPGLHLHLPWPFGIMRTVELGVVHESPVTIGADATPPSAIPAAEAIPPQTSDRLWDGVHPGESSYLIASLSPGSNGGRQSFQVVDVDLRVVWRIGASDESVRAAAYAVADPETVIRAEAGRELVGYFAHATLDAAIGANREALGGQFRTAIQKSLDALGTGIEVIDVIVEAVHPPPQAASAYHFVQAAEIIANSRVSLRRGDALRTLSLAEQSANAATNDANAAAAEQIDAATAEATGFDADRQANANDGPAFLLERRLSRLQAGLVKPDLLVMDHRLTGQAAPTIDLRDFTGIGAAGAADLAQPPPGGATGALPRMNAAPPATATPAQPAPPGQLQGDDDD